MMNGEIARLDRVEAKADDALSIARNADDRSLETFQKVGQLVAVTEAHTRSTERLATDMRAGFRALGVHLPEPLPPAATPIPPMRDPEISRHGLEVIEARVMKAIEVGIEKPDSTPEDEARRVFAEEMRKRDAAAELARLQGLEADAKEEQRKKTEAKAKAAEARRKVIYGIAGGLGLAGALRILEWIATLHH